MPVMAKSPTKLGIPVMACHVILLSHLHTCLAPHSYQSETPNILSSSWISSLVFFTHDKSFIMTHQIYDLWPSLHNGNVLMATANHLTTWDDSESWRCHLFTECCALQWRGSLTLIMFKFSSLPSTSSKSSCLAQSSCPEPCSWVNVPTASTAPCNINRDKLISMFKILLKTCAEQFHHVFFFHQCISRCPVCYILTFYQY